MAFAVHKNNTANLKRGLVERVFRVEKSGTLVPPPEPKENAFEQHCAEFRRLFRTRVHVTTPWRHEEFVACYRGRRQSVYQAAADSLLTRSVNRTDSHLSTFVKAEKINFSAKADPAPRVIQPRNPRYNVEVGKYIKKIEHAIYVGVDHVWGGPTILKGYNASNSAAILREKWDKFANPVAVGLDASRFDQHVSAQALMYEHSFYELFYAGKDREELRMLLSWQLHNKGRGVANDGVIHYSVEGRRMSGDMNTGLGNCLLMCAMVWSFCKDVGLRAALANNGDDCSLIMDSDDLAKLGGLDRWFTDMGFTMKMEEPVYEFEQIEFCQTHPIWTPEGWIMVRNAMTAIAKDCNTLTPIDSQASFDKWRYCLGEAGLHLTGGVPIFQDFYRALGRGGIPSRMIDSPQFESGMMVMAKDMHRKYTEIHPQTRFSFWLAFGITPDHQEAIEDYFSTAAVQFNAPEPQGKSEFPTPEYLSR